jgi:Transposase DDE domain
VGLPIASQVTPADVHDTVGARKLLGGLAYFVPRLTKIWADAAYQGQDLADWCKTVRGFSVLPNDGKWSARSVGSHGIAG